MEGERKRSKGSIFHFFDWNGKSRKKLFVNDSELSEGSEQGKENAESIAKSQIGEDDRRANSSNKGSSDFICISSVTSDEGFGTRAPGVVARLMGLDSLPTSNVAEPSSTPFHDSASVRASQYDWSNDNLWSEYNPMNYLKHSGNHEAYAWNSLKSRSINAQNLPIERYQTEILPPKSAKTIPITHHKLLSPIKTPGFIPTNNVACIMEAAAKIIEASPKATINGKTLSIGTSSVPLRIQDLKQKIGAAHTSRPQRPSELFSAKNTKGQHGNGSQRQSEDKLSCSASSYSEKGASDSLKKKGKSVSLSVQSKSDVHRGKVSTSKNNNIKQKEQKEIRSNQSLKSQPSAQKTKRISEGRSGNVLRQNNQKQNCVSGKESSTLKNSVSNQPGRRTQSMSSSAGHSRTTNKVVLKPETLSRKVCSVVTTSEKDKPNDLSRKKQSVNGDFQIDRSVSDNVSCNQDERSIKCNIAVDGITQTDIDNRKNGMDVISFTFTSPVKRTTPKVQPSVMGETNSSSIDSFGTNGHPYFQKSTSSFSGLNIVAGDALGVLLEQKLQELTNKVESSHYNIIRNKISASSTSSLQNFMSTVNVVTTIPAADKRIQLVEKDKSEHPDNLDCFSLEGPNLTKNQMWQGSEEMEEHSCSSNFSFAEIDLECRHPSPVSILEPTFETGGCSNTSGELFEVEGETEPSDSASSISTLDMRRKLTRTFTTTECKGSCDWELDYTRDVVNNAEKILKDFTLGHTAKVITPHLSHLLENQENGIKGNEYSKLGRKILFDCVSERLELMCAQASVGSYKSWAKMCRLFQTKGWLAEELYREMSGWKSTRDLMVDEIVDKDMSTHCGRWLDFNVEVFEEGVKIEKGILTSLVDELVSDLFVM